MRPDQSQRFIFEHADIRGETVQLEDAYREILSLHQYAPGVSRLLGEFLAASALLATTLKFEGRLVLQARSEREVPLIMAECNDNLEIRGIARGAEFATGTSFEQLLGGGQLAITIDPLRGKRYQGVVPLEENSLAHSLDSYFRQSEQLGTRVWLAAGSDRVTGLLLQQLPAQVEPDPQRRAEQWEHVHTLAATLDEAEMLSVDTPELLHRLYHQEALRLFEARPLRFHCDCSPERSYNALSALAPAELNEILQEQGAITVDCEFCNQRYRFERDDLAAILGVSGDDALH
ncbi:Hsp33 family molecular chaperone HslO [Haliea sp. E17]|uniref:Hsp33 family molecular chaperone HslO n=1 Tax=Haliea sp. E17 TaxID=3401576 RepID=UPI003AAB00CF